jgi:hypothetical protein
MAEPASATRITFLRPKRSDIEPRIGDAMNCIAANTPTSHP